MAAPARPMPAPPRPAVKDPVCGMEVNPATAKYRVDGARVGRPGAVFYFCSPTCQSKFLQAPAGFLQGQRLAMEQIVTQETGARNLFAWFSVAVGFIVLYIITPLFASGLGLPGWFNGLVWSVLGLCLAWLGLFDPFWNDRVFIMAAGTIASVIPALWAIFAAQLPAILGGIFGLMIAATVLLNGALYAGLGWKYEKVFRERRYALYIAWIIASVLSLVAIAFTTPPATALGAGLGPAR